MTSLQYKNWRVSSQLVIAGLIPLVFLVAALNLAEMVEAKPFKSGTENLSQLESHIRSLDKRLSDSGLYSKIDETPGLYSAVIKGRSKTSTSDLPQNRIVQVFDDAFANFITGNDELAISGFKSFISRFPTHPLGAKAEISLAQIYFDWNRFQLASSHFEKAKQRFQKVIGTDESRALKSAQPRTRLDEMAGSNNNKGYSSWTSDLSPELEPKLEQKQFALRKDRFSTGADQTGKKTFINDFVDNVGDRIFFDSDTSELTEASRRVLRNQALWLSRFPTLTLTLEGHSDERGTREYNLGLSARRANEAERFLRAAGISAKRIRVISYGKERPVALCNNLSCWEQNRRVVTRLNLPESAVISRSEKLDPEIRRNVPEWDAGYSGSYGIVRRRLRDV